ncbi:trypsin protease [Cymbomonas tetramitiformis]|uniref:Trypsin protease n=1 Tax=Cymbomonas tetramitiformis TaxID=36881 RepID=A0AAE0GQ84_9CHLO|nr:trypsin protease [Cymbomonas tetramitiformis]
MLALRCLFRMYTALRTRSPRPLLVASPLPALLYASGSGVISGLDRQIQSQVGSTISGGLQTDAAINPGNSGCFSSPQSSGLVAGVMGPLLDSSGRLIGINTAIFTNSGTSAGVGFAIPADTVRRIIPQLIGYGRVVRPSLGVQVANPGIAKQLSVKTGVLVQAVIPKGSADLAGILPTRRGLGGIIRGDVILAVGDKLVSNSTDLEDAIEAYSVGDIARLQVERQESKDKVVNLDITVKLKEENTK